MTSQLLMQCNKVHINVTYEIINEEGKDKNATIGKYFKFDPIFPVNYKTIVLFGHAKLQLSYSNVCFNSAWFGCEFSYILWVLCNYAISRVHFIVSFN